MTDPLRIRLNGVRNSPKELKKLEQVIRKMSCPPLPKDQPIEFYIDDLVGPKEDVKSKRGEVDGD